MQVGTLVNELSLDTSHLEEELSTALEAAEAVQATSLEQLDQVERDSELRDAQAEVAALKRRIAELTTEAQDQIDTLNGRIESLERQNTGLRTDLTIAQGELIKRERRTAASAARNPVASSL